MADNSIPLLHPPPELGGLPPDEEKRTIASLDDMIERCLGSIGAAQLFQAFLVSLAWAFEAQQTFISVFTDAAPSWHCTVPDYANSSTTCSTSLPLPCGLPDGTWAWDRPAYVSVISQWSLECAGHYITGLPASAYFAGSLVGTVALSTLADSTLGRKKMLFFSCLATAVAGMLTAASSNIWVYSALRFVSGLSRVSIVTSALVLSTELVGKAWRGQIGVIGYFCFTLGFLSLPYLAYAYRNSPWQALYLWASAPALLYSILFYFLVRESPRWLLVHGRRDEAVKVLKDIAGSDGKVDAGSLLAFDVFVVEGEGNRGVTLCSAVRVLARKRWVLRRLLAVMAVSFGIGMVYYGMPLALGTLGSNLYVSVALNALSELPSSLVTFFLIGRINRRDAVLGLALTSGACSVACVFVEEVGVRMGVEVASFFCACTACNVALIYVLELFPTCVRNSALSIIRAAVVLGGVFAPLLAAAAREKGGRFMSFGVFGLVIGCCGLFVVRLPETRGRGICDTLEEQEHEEETAAAAGGTVANGKGESSLM